MPFLRTFSIVRRCSIHSTLAALPLLAAFSHSGLIAQGQEAVQAVPGAAVASIPTIDLNDRTDWQVVVDREPGQYLGHPTTLLLEDGKTILCVYPKGHGKGAIIYKRSSDGGKTWSERLPTPQSWETSKETPTLHRVVDAAGKKRIIMFSGMYPVRMASSEDDGATWSELAPVGEWGGIVAMASVVACSTPGHYIALFHDDQRYFSADGKGNGGKVPPGFTLYQSRSTDGGLTWGQPVALFNSKEVHLCEPGAIHSPDGKEIAVILRENRRVKNSHIIFSTDDGQTWTAPKELPAALTGDRHTAKYAQDGRLVISFRDAPPKSVSSPTAGDWVAWVGRYDDLEQGTSGEYRLRLKDNTHAWDCAYPGVEVLPSGEFVVTTYGHWEKGEKPYILSVRLNLQETDQLAKAAKK